MLRIRFKQKETKATKVLRNQFGLESNFVSLPGLVDRRKAARPPTLKGCGTIK